MRKKKLEILEDGEVNAVTQAGRGLLASSIHNTSKFNVHTQPFLVRYAHRERFLSCIF